MRFIDLFAGLGGFHLALTRLGHECVFASEIDDELRMKYLLNFPEMAHKTYGDIRRYKKRIPPHDVLCAGFPCQPFSKSGGQLGTMDKMRGTLFHEIIKILRTHKPRYFILENVGNFERHDSGNTWRIVKTSLTRLGYDVRGTEHACPAAITDWRDRTSQRNDSRNGSGRRVSTGRRGISQHLRHAGSIDRGHGLISPHHLGYPQHRERFFIVGSYAGLPPEPFPPVNRDRQTSLEMVLQPSSELSDLDRIETALSEQQERCINLWDALLKAIPDGIDLPSFPIWGDEINAKYPFEESTPWATRPSELRRLVARRRFPPGTRKMTLLQALPSYAREEAVRFREWKVHYIRQNREWLARVEKYMPDGWVNQLMRLPPSLRKLEWNAKGGKRDLWRYVLQFRPSGLRVKRYSSSPALVAMTATQIPILGPERRFLTRTEGLRLQGFPDNWELPSSRGRVFAALGNAVHVEVALEIAQRLLADGARNLTPRAGTVLQRRQRLTRDQGILE